MDFWTGVERIGFPAAVLLGLGLALWKILIWIGREVVKPISSSHIALVESTKKTNEINADTLQKVASILQAKVQKLESIEIQSDKILAISSKNHQLLLRQEEKRDAK